MLAEVTSDVDLYQYGWEALTFLLLLGGVVFFLGNLVLGHSPVSSAPSRFQQQGDVADLLKSRVGLESMAANAIPPPVNQPLSKKERRASMRRHGNPVKVAVANPSSPEQPLEGLVLNRSKGGLQLSINHAVSVGTVLGIRASSGAEDLPWVQVRVRRCRQDGDSWRLGCQFVETLPWSVLLLFG
jgi:PilZ domain